MPRSLRALALLPLLLIPAAASAADASGAVRQVALPAPGGDLHATAKARPGKAPKRAPRLSAEEMQTVRSWARVLQVMQRKSAAALEVSGAGIASQIKDCPRPVSATGAALDDADFEGLQLATVMLAAVVEMVVAYGPEADLAAGRIEGLPVASSPLRRWRTVQLRHLRELTQLAGVIAPDRNYCTFMTLAAASPADAEDLPPEAYAALGLTASGIQLMQSMGGSKQQSADTRAQRQAKDFLLSRGVRKLNITDTLG